MPLKPIELGDRQHVDLRTGVAGIDKWRGCVREGDPACIGDSNLRYAENVRLTGGKILSRGGQAAVNTSAANGCIDGFFDAGDMGAQSPGAYVYDACSVGTGSSVSERVWTRGRTVLDLHLAYYDTTNGVILISEDHGGSLPAQLMASDATLGVIAGVQNAIYTIQENAQVPVLAFTSTGSTNYLASYAKFGSNYYFGRASILNPGQISSTCSSDILVWDGASASSYEAVEASTKRYPLLCAYNSDLYVSYATTALTSAGPNTTTSTLYYRNGGAYTNITFPVNRFTTGHMTVIGSDLWIAGGVGDAASGIFALSGRIVKVNGTTATLERSISGGASSMVLQIIPVGSDFYYLWIDRTNNVAYLGSCIGGVYNDTAKTLASGADSLFALYYGVMGGTYYFRLGSTGGIYSTTNLTGSYTLLSDAGACFGAATLNQLGSQSLVTFPHPSVVF